MWLRDPMAQAEFFCENWEEAVVFYKLSVRTSWLGYLGDLGACVHFYKHGIM